MARKMICPTCSPNFPMADFRRGLAPDCATHVHICNRCGHQRLVQSKPLSKKMATRFEEMILAANEGR